MQTNHKIEKTRFFRKWVITNSLIILIGYPIVLFISILIWEAMGHSMNDWGTAFEQSMLQITGGVIIGLGLGFFQWKLLRKIFHVGNFWIYSIAISIIVVEIIAGLICWRLGLNRGEFNFFENKPFQHALITASYGLLIGLVQLPLLKRSTVKSACWIIGNIIAWGLTILVMSIGLLFENEIFLLLTCIVGGVFFGTITGVFLILRMKLLDQK